jgi:hypothetical protein
MENGAADHVFKGDKKEWRPKKAFGFADRMKKKGKIKNTAAAFEGRSDSKAGNPSPLTSKIC